MKWANRYRPTAIQGSQALVTGATGGLGQSIARRMAAEGARVNVTGRQTGTLDALATELGNGSRAITANLAGHAALTRLVKCAGPIDVLVANAGIDQPDQFVDTDPDTIENTIAVNLTSTIQLARMLLPGMIERRTGHVVFLSSLAGKIGTLANGTVYTATKWGLRGFALTLAEELRGTGVTVSTIFPGPIRDAGMFAATDVALPRGTGTRSPEDVAHAVIEAIRTGRNETDIVPPSMKLGATLGTLTPRLTAAYARRLGVGEVRAAMARAHHSGR